MFRLLIGGVLGALVVTNYPELSQMVVESGIKDYVVNQSIGMLESMK